MAGPAVADWHLACLDAHLRVAEVAQARALAFAVVESCEEARCETPVGAVAASAVEPAVVLGT
eukprot:597639-Pleurochrysis_carterae.AAC.2